MYLYEKLYSHNLDCEYECVVSLDMRTSGRSVLKVRKNISNILSDYTASYCGKFYPIKNTERRKVS
jgi:hypothetical protein